MMTAAYAFVPSLPFHSRARSFKLHISRRSSNYSSSSAPPTCATQPPPRSSPQPNPSAFIDDPQPPRSPIFKLFASLRRTRKETLAAYGIAAFISYGLFDAVTYTASFLLSLRAYIAAGKTLTWRTLPQVLAVMWGINNLSRPFRVGGALALAPVVDRRIVRPVRTFLARRANDS